MAVLTDNEKNEVRESLAAYVARYPSQNKAAESLRGTSPGTVSAILNGKWKNVSDEMFRSIADQTGAGRNADRGWVTVETRPFKEITYAMEDAQAYTNVTWVVGDAGCGKTTTARTYASEHREVFYVLCSEDMRRGDFVREIARMTGVKADGCTLRETWGLVMGELIQMDSPLLVFDEADKLTEPVFHYFISLYNKLEDRCGVIFLSTDYIKKRVQNGLRYCKPGYKEFYSRMGRKFYELADTTAQDVYGVCVRNGVTEKRDIDEIIRDAETCGFDLRRVKKAVHRKKRMRG